jgi:hypothetical protein
VNNPLSFLTGLVIGVGATVVARDLVPTLAPQLRTLTKHGLKFTVRSFERGRETLALATESLSDILAEVQAELQVERSTPTPASGSDPLLNELLAEDQATHPALEP